MIEIKAGDVLLVWGEGFIAEAIEDITHGPSHCALFLDANTLIEAQGGKVSGEIALSNYLNQNKKLEVWRDPTLSDEDRIKMIQFARTQLGIQYDYLAIFGEFLRFKFDISLDYWNENKKRICSSFVNGIALSIHHIWSKVHIPAPIDFINDGFLRKVGELNHGQ